MHADGTTSMGQAAAQIPTALQMRVIASSHVDLMRCLHTLSNQACGSEMLGSHTTISSQSWA